MVVLALKESSSLADVDSVSFIIFASSSSNSFGKELFSRRCCRRLDFKASLNRLVVAVEPLLVLVVLPDNLCCFDVLGFTVFDCCSADVDELVVGCC